MCQTILGMRSRAEREQMIRVEARSERCASSEMLVGTAKRCAGKSWKWQSLVCSAIDALQYGEGRKWDEDAKRSPFMSLGLDSLDSGRFATNLNAALAPLVDVLRARLRHHDARVDLSEAPASDNRPLASPPRLERAQRKDVKVHEYPSRAQHVET